MKKKQRKIKIVHFIVDDLLINLMNALNCVGGEQITIEWMCLYILCVFTWCLLIFFHFKYSSMFVDFFLLNCHQVLLIKRNTSFRSWMVPILIWDRDRDRDHNIRKKKKNEKKRHQQIKLQTSDKLVKQSVRARTLKKLSRTSSFVRHIYCWLWIAECKKNQK